MKKINYLMDESFHTKITQLESYHSIFSTKERIEHELKRFDYSDCASCPHMEIISVDNHDTNYIIYSAQCVAQVCDNASTRKLSYSDIARMGKEMQDKELKEIEREINCLDDNPHFGSFS